MMKRLAISLLCVLAISSYAQPVTIDMLAAYKNPSSIKLSDIASSIRYIKLETPDDALIGHTYMMDIRNEHLVVAYDAIYLFDTLGHFKKVLARKGRGPGEYIEFGGMQFAPKEELLYLHNRAGNTMLRIDLNSGFLDQIKGMNGMISRPLGDDMYALFYPFRFLMMSKYHSIEVVNSKGKVIERMMKYPKGVLDDLEMIPSQNFGMYPYQDSLTIWDGFNDTIVRLAQDLSLTPKYVLDFGKEKLPNRIKGGMNNPKYWDEVNKYSRNSKVFETQKYLLLTSSFKGSNTHLLHNKNAHETVSMDWQEIIENDIDGGVDFWPHGVTSNGELYLIVQMSILKKHFLGKEDSNSKIAQIVKASQEEDNPVIMIVTLK